MARRSRQVRVDRFGVVKRENKQNYDKIGDGWIFLVAMFRYFPDFLLDTLRVDDAQYELSFLQRLIIRAKARYKYVYITGCRGLTKSFCTILEEQCEMLSFPGIKVAYYGPAFKQTARIGSQIFKEISRDYPALSSHYQLEQDSIAGAAFKIITEYNSSLDISSYRGDTVHKIVVEEMAQEENPKFNHEEYRSVVIPTMRAEYRSRAYKKFKIQIITSAGRRQNPAYDVRCTFQRLMNRGEDAFVVDIPYGAVVLTMMRPPEWADIMKDNLTPEEWLREMESRYTGADQNALVRDETISRSRTLLMMEEHHCCKDYANKLLPEDVFYIIGYDVSYADGANNAKCACVVLKCTKQEQYNKRNRYLKQLVWIDDWTPTNEISQAQKLKKIWSRFSFEGSKAYIAIDAWQYGTSVVQALMRDLGDGLIPLCTFNHTMFTDLELVDSEPLIYPIKAGGAGTVDSDAEMIRNAELQFENGNVELLTSDYRSGTESYKKYHRIKDDSNDYLIYNPYKKTNELVSQLQNLKKVPNANGVSEKRISHRIQRDSWSALKYALRLAQRLEQTYLMRTKKESDWDKVLKQYKNGVPQGTTVNAPKSRLITQRHGGRMF